jgi:Lactate racemase N-terminal domain
MQFPEKDAPAGGIDELLDSVPIPRMIRVAQSFQRPRLQDIEGELERRLDEKALFASVTAGSSVAVAVGSRGIANLPDVVKVVIRRLRQAGASPFIVPAMGSHGGATAEGQRSLLERLGVSEEYTGAPVRSSMKVTKVSNSPRFGAPVYLDAAAREADGIVIINRVKSHPAYSGRYESGLVKMAAIGLGKQKQAEFCHNAGAGRIGEYIEDIGLELLKNINLLGAVALVENAFFETAQIEVLRADEIASQEPRLLEAAKELAARFYIDEFDVLIIDEIGKEISGAGFDTTIVGRYSSPYRTGGPRISRVAVLDITEKSNGYGGGLGMVDFTTLRAFNKFDPAQTYPNTLTSTYTEGVKIPMVLKNDRQALQACLKTCNQMDLDRARVVRIRNTLCMEEISISESLRDEAERHANMRILGPPGELVFDGEGNLF